LTRLRHRHNIIFFDSVSKCIPLEQLAVELHVYHIGFKDGGRVGAVLLPVSYLMTSFVFRRSKSLHSYEVKKLSKTKFVDIS